MPQLVCMGAMLMCPFGVAPAPLSVVPMGRPVQTSKQLAANVNAFQPMANIPSFGMCMSPANPQVAAATAAALGVLTPMPCIPATSAPWMPGSLKVMVDGSPALTSACQCQCMWGGVITVSSPGQMTVSD
jgi:hypothetical protein